MTIRGKYFPEEYPGMLKHFDTVKRLCYQQKAGIQYDRQFRTMKADFPQLPWSQFMPELVFEPSLNRQFFGKPRQNFNRSSFAGRRQLPGSCDKFNGGFCSFGSQCKFRHACSSCGSRQHTAKGCYKTRK